MDDCLCRAVIGLVDTAQADIQRARGDVGRRAAGIRVQHIVACIKSSYRNIRYVDGLASTRILVAKRRTARDRQRIAGNPVIAEGHSGGNGAVIGFVDAAQAHVQRARSDVGGGAAGIGAQHIVARVEASQRYIRYSDGLASTRVLVAKGRIARHRQRIAGDAVVAEVDDRTRRAVIGLVDAAQTHIQRTRGDVGRRAAGAAAQHVVARIEASQRDIRYVDGLARARVLVAKRRVARYRQGVACNPVIAEVDHGARRAVIGLVDAAQAHIQRARGDVGRRAASIRVQHIIARVEASQRNIRYVDGLARARVLVAKRRVARYRQGVACNPVIAEVDHCARRAVISLVDAAQADIQRARGDVGRRAAGAAAQHIVARIEATQRNIRYVHGLARARILVAKRRIARHRQRIASDPVIAKVDDCSRRAVIGLVDPAQADVQRARGNVGRRAAGIRVQHVVARIESAQGDVRHSHGLAGACIFITKRRIARHRQGIAGNPVVAEGHAGSDGAVIGFVDAAHAHVQRACGDVGRGAATIRVQHIVACVLSRQVPGGHLVIHNLAIAGILVAEAA